MPIYQTGTDPKPAPSVVDSWKSAAIDLFTARADLIRLELAEFRAQSARKAAFMVAAALAATCGWLLFLAAMVPVLSHALRVSWSHTAILLAALHMIVAALCGWMASRKSSPPFSATLSEFQKDREWLQNLSNRKS